VSEQESDSQIKTIAGPGPGFKDFGTGAQSESVKVTRVTSDKGVADALKKALHHLKIWVYKPSYICQSDSRDVRVLILFFS